MFTLLSGLYGQLTQKPTFSVVIVGLDNAGKSTLLERVKLLKSGSDTAMSISTTPTVGMNKARCWFEGTVFQFWDLGGAADLHRLWPRYYPDCHAVFFVVDSTDSARMHRCRHTLEGVVADAELEGVPIALLANKQDVKECLGLAEIKEIFNPAFARLEARETKAFAVSAATGEGVQEAMSWLKKVVELNSPTRPPAL